MPTIAVLGTLDTKGEEHAYIAEINCGMGKNSAGNDGAGEIESKANNVHLYSVHHANHARSQ